MNWIELWAKLEVIGLFIGLGFLIICAIVSLLYAIMFRRKK